MFDQLHHALLAGAQRSRADRLVAGVYGCLPRPREKGRRHRPQARRPRQTGSKHHLICDGGGIPLAVTLTGGNRNDITQLVPLLDAVPAVRGRPGRPRRKPDNVVADRGYATTSTGSYSASVGSVH